MSVNPIPEGYHTVTPYLLIKNAASAIEFYQKAFGATVMLRVNRPNGIIRHAEIMIGSSPVMLADDPTGTADTEHSPLSMFLYVEDADAFAKRAVAAGANMIAPLEDHPDEGDRRG